ncbi:MAG: HD domain-containing protein [Bacilli bacterium]|nr:HD domain-containing protein [Bacilli bacterium]
MKEINNELIKFMEENIFPIYDTFDKGHNLDHIFAVIERAIKIYNSLNNDDLDINIVYAAAALHDIGVQVERKNHALHSSEFVMSCIALREFFSEEEIITIANACEDHSTSKGIEPRSLYGKIVCDADKDNNVEISLLRAYEFTKKYYPDFTEEQCLDNVYDQLYLKFGPEGKVKFYVGAPEQSEFLHTMQSLALDKSLFISKMAEVKNNNFHSTLKKD